MTGNNKSTFALYFGNRGFFPASLMASARKEMERTLNELGYKTLMLDAQATRHGAVETTAEGNIYARFLKEHEGEFQGVILCLPNFGDENGAVAALKDADVPIFIHAYPDELDKMAPELRRDSFCGKISITDVFYQYGIKHTSLRPHTCAPSSHTFANQIDYFNRVCQVVAGLKRMTVGAIGARVTPFKTVRIDEIALQRHGINVETFDLSDTFARMRKIKESDSAFKDKSELLKGYTDFSKVPEPAFNNLVRLGVALDNIKDEYSLDAIALRCWMELEQEFGISPCVMLSEMNNRFFPAACENDIGNAIAMYALSKASGNTSACLDWNNNYEDEDDKCILFHCGPIPQSMMIEKGEVTDHALLMTSLGPGCAYGCNTGRIKPMDFTFGSIITDSGQVRMLTGQGAFTDDYIPDDFFGCAGVAFIPNLQDVLQCIVYHGHKHHVSVTEGHVEEALREAAGYYLDYDLED